MIERRRHARASRVQPLSRLRERAGVRATLVRRCASRKSFPHPACGRPLPRAGEAKADARRDRPLLARASAHRHRAQRADRGARRRGAARRALRRVSGFRAAARARANRNAGPRRDAGRSARHAPARRPARRHRKRAHGALDVEPGPVGDPRDLRSRRRSVSAAPGRHRTSRRSERPAAAGREPAAALAAVARRWNISSISASRASSFRRSSFAISSNGSSSRRSSPCPASRRRRSSAAKCASGRCRSIR